MSFATDLYYIMKNDASLNEWTGNRIHYENLPTNFEVNRTWIVYSFNKDSQTSCIDGTAAYVNYKIVANILGTDTLEVEAINDRLVDYLCGAAYEGIQQIAFEGDNHNVDLDKGLYMNTLQFNAQYVKA